MGGYFSEKWGIYSTGRNPDPMEKIPGLSPFLEVKKMDKRIRLRTG